MIRSNRLIILIGVFLAIMVFVLTILFFGHSGNGNERFPGGYITSSVNGADQVCYSAYDQHDNLLVRDCNVEAK